MPAATSSSSTRPAGDARLLGPRRACVFAWSRRLYGDVGRPAEPGPLVPLPERPGPRPAGDDRRRRRPPSASAPTYAFWRYSQRPDLGRAVARGVALGLAELAKFSMLLLYGLWPADLAPPRGARDRPRAGRPRRLGRAAVQGAAIVALSVLTIDLGYGFEGVGRPLGASSSSAGRSPGRGRGRSSPPTAERPARPDAWIIGSTASAGPPSGRLPRPLPAYYLIGFDAQKLEADGVPKSGSWRPRARRRGPPRASAPAIRSISTATSATRAGGITTSWPSPTRSPRGPGCWSCSRSWSWRSRRGRAPRGPTS